jgi:hypothetical protein
LTGEDLQNQIADQARLFALNREREELELRIASRSGESVACR